MVKNLSSLQGKGNVRFSELFANTVEVFGMEESMRFYTARGMSWNEFWLWMQVIGK